jgi:hypothetical protein
MEEIKNKISERNYYFLKKFEEYIGSDLIFFGSIMRYDYNSKSSDIDIAIISDNINSTLIRLKNFLNIDNRKIRKIYQKTPNSKNIITGYKTNYDDYENNLSLEIVLYDKKYRKEILESINKINSFPFYITYTLFIIKLLYYNLNIMPKELFDTIKKIIIRNYLNQELKDNLIAIKI